MKQAGVVLVPAYARASPECLCELRLDLDRCQSELESAGQKSWAVVVRQSKGLFFRESEPANSGIIGHITACRLGSQPLTHVAFGSACTLCQLGRGQRACAGHCLVEPQLITDDDQIG